MTAVLAVESGGKYIDLPEPSYKGYNCVWQELTVAERNSLGFLVKRRITTKYNIKVKWVGLTKAEKDSLITLTNDNSFGLRFLDTMDDTWHYVSASEGGFYRGSDLAISPYGTLDETTGEFPYYDVNMTLIER